MIPAPARPRVAVPTGAFGWGTVRSLVFGAATGALVAIAPTRGLVALMDSGATSIAPFLPGAAVFSYLIPIALVVLAARLTRRLSAIDRAAIRAGYVTGLAIFLFVFLAPDTGGWRDALAYHTIGLDDPYGLAYASGGIRYAPPFFQVIDPLRAIPWPAFLFLWTAVQMACLWLMAGPLAAVLLLIPVVAFEAWFENINILLAAAIVMGFRWPALWAFVILTKVTPGVSLIWFVVRREWRNLGVALGVTAAIATVSLVLAPGLWVDWVRALATSAPPEGAIDVISLPVRLALAGLLVAWGGLHDRPWTVPVAAVLGLPVLWPAGFAILVATVPLTRASSARFLRRAVDRAQRLPIRHRSEVGKSARPFGSGLSRLRLRPGKPV